MLQILQRIISLVYCQEKCRIRFNTRIWIWRKKLRKFLKECLKRTLGAFIFFQVAYLSWSGSSNPNSKSGSKIQIPNTDMIFEANSLFLRLPDWKFAWPPWRNNFSAKRRGGRGVEGGGGQCQGLNEEGFFFNAWHPFPNYLLQNRSLVNLQHTAQVP